MLLDSINPCFTNNTHPTLSPIVYCIESPWIVHYLPLIRAGLHQDPTVTVIHHAPQPLRHKKHWHTVHVLGYASSVVAQSNITTDINLNELPGGSLSTTNLNNPHLDLDMAVLQRGCSGALTLMSRTPAAADIFVEVALPIIVCLIPLFFYLYTWLWDRRRDSALNAKLAAFEAEIGTTAREIAWRERLKLIEAWEEAKRAMLEHEGERRRYFARAEGERLSLDVDRERLLEKRESARRFIGGGGDGSRSSSSNTAGIDSYEYSYTRAPRYGAQSGVSSAENLMAIHSAPQAGAYSQETCGRRPGGATKPRLQTTKTGESDGEVRWWNRKKLTPEQVRDIHEKWSEWLAQAPEPSITSALQLPPPAYFVDAGKPLPPSASPSARPARGSLDEAALQAIPSLDEVWQIRERRRRESSAVNPSGARAGTAAAAAAAPASTCRSAAARVGATRLAKFCRELSDSCKGQGPADLEFREAFQRWDPTDEHEGSLYHSLSHLSRKVQKPL